MRTSHFSVLFIVFLTVVGCGSKQQATSGPVQGTMNTEGLTVDQQIEQVRNSKEIPEQYKETYINSLKAKAGQRQ